MSALQWRRPLFRRYRSELVTERIARRVGWRLYTEAAATLQLAQAQLAALRDEHRIAGIAGLDGTGQAGVRCSCGAIGCSSYKILNGDDDA